MGFWNKISTAVQNWMRGRNGTDQLGIFTLMTGLVLSLIGSFSGGGFVSFLGFVFYVVTIFRMCSRNIEARRKENQKYMELTGNFSLKMHQFIQRTRNRKTYKYFRCPECRQLLRLKRGCGEKMITCAKCGHQFRQKA